MSEEARVAGILHDVVFVDGVRTPFGTARDTGMYAQTREFVTNNPLGGSPDGGSDESV